jgi:polo-like kinase 1
MKGVVVVLPHTLTRVHSTGKTDRYQRFEELGRGGFATVYRVVDEMGRAFALKATSKDRLGKFMQKHRTEISIHRSLSHPNVVKFVDCFEDATNAYMVLELCPGHSVRDLLKQKGNLDEQETRRILRDVLEGVSYLHDRRIIHRDLKLENFFLGENGRVKIGDFGLSAKLSYGDERQYSMCGTPNYLSPEVVADLLHTSSSGHSYEVDIWAIGVCAFAMLTGHPPFETRHAKLTYDHIAKCQYSFPVELRLSSVAKDFIRKILQINPENRPSAYDLQQHPFLANSVREVENVPTYAVARFCDHGEKYGLGYLLVDGTIGACFNDLSRMVMDPFGEFVQYWETYHCVQPVILRLDDIVYAKKLAILKKFAESLKKTARVVALPVMNPSKYVPMRHVKYWMKTSDAMLFRMDDRTIQVNFNDRMKLIIFHSTRLMMCVQNVRESGSLIPLDGLFKTPGLEDEKRRFTMAKAMITEMGRRHHHATAPNG